MSLRYFYHYRDTFDCWLISRSDSGTMFEIFVENIQLGNDPSKTNMECLDKVNIHACKSMLIILVFTSEKNTYILMTAKDLLLFAFLR